MIYLRKFENYAAYEAAKSNLILPNVSLITENNKVEYNPLTPPAPSHDYVEIGGIKWASMNIGATAVTDTGVYFQWGDTQGYTAAQVGTDKNFTWDDYIYYDSENYEFTKYNSNDGLTTLQATDDAVQYAWNGNWRMPTFSEFQTLGEAVNTAWTQVNGVSGMMCTDKTDETKTLFFPACGYADDGGLYNVGISGMYWCSILYYDGDNEAYSLEFDEGGPAFGASYNRSHGFVIRGVLDE